MTISRIRSDASLPCGLTQNDRIRPSGTRHGETLCVAHIAKMFELMGDDAAKSASEAQAVMTLETKFAEASKPPVELRDPEKNYHRMPMAQLRNIRKLICWRI